MGVYGYDYSNKLLPDGYYDAVLTNHVGEKIEKNFYTQHHWKYLSSYKSSRRNNVSIFSESL